MSLVQSKLPDVGTTIFSVMSKMAADYGALNLSQGFPDFPVSSELIDLVYKYMKAGKNQYAPMPGVPELRKAISQNVQTKHGVVIDPDSEITITAGATEAIYATLTAAISQGDEVIIFDPAYDCYAPAIRLSGGTPIHLALKQPTFSIDWKEVERTITEKTRAIVINSPHNPSGAILSRQDLLTLEQLAVKFDLLVISDEVYEHIIFESQLQSALCFAELRRRSAVVYSFGKTFHVTGWKCGYVIAPESLTKEIRKVHQYLVFSVNTPLQYALAEFLENEKNHQNIADLYNRKRKLFREVVSSSKFDIAPCYGTYFQLLSYKNISDLSDVAMAEKLTKENKIASIPISVFYEDNQDDHFLRFCFAKNEETLEKAGEILCKI